VTSDNYTGGTKAARFLIAGGHKKIAYLAGWDGASTSRDREIGFVNTLEQNGLSLYAREVGNFGREEACEATHRMFAGNNSPDAVFVANDHMALAVMDTLRYELGLKIPEEVSVIGFDDVPAASWPAYNLTTVRQRSNLMVTETIKVLLAQIDGTADQCQQVAIGSPLIVRGSSRIPEGWN
jgi:DNA-binding LacI/PurR family transcriptional regulator